MNDGSAWWDVTRTMLLAALGILLCAMIFAGSCVACDRTFAGNCRDACGSAGVLEYGGGTCKCNKTTSSDP